MTVPDGAIDARVWLPPPSDLVLAPGDVHVWRIELDLPGVDVAVLNALVLAPDERLRVARFRRPIDGVRFCVARARLRQVLARYAGCAPGDVAFVVDDLGKPHLATGIDRAGGVDTADLVFNLSHSGGLALVAVVRGCRVGVDVETGRGHNDLAAIAARYFSPKERAFLGGLGEEAWRDAFFVLWTAKEAYTKAIGAGLSAGFTRFDVDVHADGSLSLGGTIADADDTSTGAWSVRRLTPGPGYCGALAVDRPSPSLACWRWTA